jgi:glutamate-1-semialdehyde 2,1-aminomutase
MMPTTTSTLDQRQFVRAVRVTPGASQTRSKAPGRVGPRDPDLPFPLFAAGGHGAYLVGLDGTAYLDFAGANAAIPLGYDHPRVTAAVCEQAHAPLLSLPSPLETQVAEQLIEMLPFADAVRFVRTGSEACTAALTIARSVTGRRTAWVGTWSYHGWHPPFAQRGAEQTREYLLNDDGIFDALRRQPPACVFFEPPRWDTVSRAWLDTLRAVTRETSTLLIFDELVAGFRLALRGGSEFYEVTPDLACYGKALGNGYPIAALVGPRDLVAHAGPLVSGTHGGELTALAAAQAVLDIYRERDVIGILWHNGRLFWSAVAGALPGAAVLQGMPVHFRIALPDEELRDRVLVRCAARGILFHRDACNASAVMTPDEIERAAHVLADAIKEG